MMRSPHLFLAAIFAVALGSHDVSVASDLQGFSRSVEPYRVHLEYRLKVPFRNVSPLEFWLPNDAIRRASERFSPISTTALRQAAREERGVQFNDAVLALAARYPAVRFDAESAEHFARLRHYLDDSGIEYTINPRLVRGLDYYCRTVFEWVTDQLGAQGTVCAGGRYDGLVEQLGGKSTPASGFALGIERLLALREAAHVAAPRDTPDVYLVLQGESGTRKGLALAEQLRNENPGLSILSNCGGGSFKSQMKKADKSGAAIALILGEDEMAGDTVTIKYLREHKAQQTISQCGLNEFFRHNQV